MRRLIEIATERRVTVVMLMVAVGLFGTVSLSRLNLNLLPDVSYPTLTIRTELTGAAPVEVENLVTNRSRKPSASSATSGWFARSPAPDNPT